MCNCDLFIVLSNKGFTYLASLIGFVVPIIIKNHLCGTVIHEFIKNYSSVDLHLPKEVILLFVMCSLKVFSHGHVVNQ